MSSRNPPIVVLFGYEGSTFTLKTRLVLKLKQIPYTFIAVPSMMPRPLLRDTFNLTYRKIPVLAIGRDLYCDSSLIIEALEHFFPESEGYRSIYPTTADGRNYRSLIRGFASYWTDRPIFRTMCGLMPGSIWRSAFGRDREQLIGHSIDADKLERQFPESLSKFDMHLSSLEPLFENQDNGPFIFSTSTPSLADLSLYYQFDWGCDMAAGRLQSYLTAGETVDTDTDGATTVFNMDRYPGLITWFNTLENYFNHLPPTEEKVEDSEQVKKQIQESPSLGPKSLLLPTPRSTHVELDERNGLLKGVAVSVTPDDTGMNDPTFGTLLALSPEEIVIKPRTLDPPASIDVRVHFPRLGFVVRTVKGAML